MRRPAVSNRCEAGNLRDVARSASLSQLSGHTVGGIFWGDATRQHSEGTNGDQTVPGRSILYRDRSAPSGPRKAAG